MKLLLDESLPRRLKRVLHGHEVVTVPEQGWAGKTNGELLRLAAEHFDGFVTADQNLEYQQNLEGAQIAVLVLAAKTNRFEDLEPLVPSVQQSLSRIQRGEVVRVSM